VLGVAIGWLFGWWIGNAMLALYGDFFRFPFILRDPSAAAVALSAAAGAGGGGAGRHARGLAALRLPPAEAMSPPAPPVFTRGWLDRCSGAIRLRQTTMMIFRSIIRWPGRAAITLFGVSASVAVLVSSYFLFDAMEVVDRPRLPAGQPPAHHADAEPGAAARCSTTRWRCPGC
jgi:putative ABC transport system permease protein